MGLAATLEDPNHPCCASSGAVGVGCAGNGAVGAAHVTSAVVLASLQPSQNDEGLQETAGSSPHAFESLRDCILCGSGCHPTLIFGHISHGLYGEQLSDRAPAPSSASHSQLIEGTGSCSDPSPFELSNSMQSIFEESFYSLNVFNTPHCVRCPRIDADTVYDIYLLAEDNAAPPNIQSAVSPVVSALTARSNGTGGFTAPTFNTTYPPQVTITGSSYFYTAVRLDADSEVAYAVMDAGSAAPTSAELFAGVAGKTGVKNSGTSSTMTAGQEGLQAMHGSLEPSTSYDVYLAARSTDNGHTFSQAYTTYLAGYTTTGASPKPIINSTVSNTNTIFPFTIVFDRPVTDFQCRPWTWNCDVDVTGGTVTDNDVSNPSEDMMHWEGSITPTRDGEVTVSVEHGRGIDNYDGGLSERSNTLVVNYDTVRPNVTLSIVSSSQLNMIFRINFSEPVFDFGWGSIKKTGCKQTAFDLITPTLVWEATISFTSSYCLVEVPENNANDTAKNPNFDSNKLERVFDGHEADDGLFL
ncbi:hypothetical protein CYMTET_40312, partial [Cymbomonas tetramitiformis]